MNDILKKQALNPAMTLKEIYAPMVAGKAEPGQFIILRADENGERIPLTIVDSDREKGSITVIFQITGATTEVLNHLNEGGCIHDLAGPLGKATETAGLKKAVVIGGGAGCAITYPIVKKLFSQGCEVDVIAGFRSRDLVILEEELRKTCRRFTLVTDDGSSGTKGFVTDALKALLERGEGYDKIFAIGPLVMMKAVCKLTKAYGIKTIVSMNSIMIDGTGMCGGCRVSVGGETKFACVDGPDFDGHQIDFYEAMSRSVMYQTFERKMHKGVCRLYGGSDHV